MRLINSRRETGNWIHFSGSQESVTRVFSFARAIQETRTREMFFKSYRSHRIEFPQLGDSGVQK
jgi:hypothetical protein